MTDVKDKITQLDEYLIKQREDWTQKIKGLEIFQKRKSAFPFGKILSSKQPTLQLFGQGRYTPMPLQLLTNP